MKRWVPKAEIQFAARFGFLTKDLWLKFFEVGGRTSRFVRWKRLRDRGFFRIHPASRSDDILILNTANVWRFCLSEPVLPPPIAQIRHDEIAAQGALQLEASSLFSEIEPESQLKRVGFEWNGAKDKYPDLAIRIGEGRVAIEIELTQKSGFRYRGISDSYRRRAEYQYAIFVVPNKTIMQAVAKAFAKSQCELGFMKLEDWMRDPLNASIALAHSGTSLPELCRELSGEHRELGS